MSKYFNDSPIEKPECWIRDEHAQLKYGAVRLEKGGRPTKRVSPRFAMQTAGEAKNVADVDAIAVVPWDRHCGDQCTHEWPVRDRPH